MESTVCFLDQLSDAGRSDLVGNYWRGSEYTRDPIKHEQRERVLDFFLETARVFPESVKPRVLSFPGIDWTFENMVLAKSQASIVGLERSKTVYHRSRRNIPGVKGSHNNYRFRLIDKFLPYGNGSICYSRVKIKSDSSGIVSRSNRLLLMDAETYMSMYFTDYGASVDERNGFWKRFYNRNCIWLDYTSQLCAPIEATIKRLQFCLEPPSLTPYDKPVVFTLLNARDEYHGADERVQRIVNIQPELKYSKHWTYVGKGGLSMLTACFTMR